MSTISKRGGRRYHAIFRSAIEFLGTIGSTNSTPSTTLSRGAGLSVQQPGVDDTPFLATLRAEVLDRLGDTAQTIWDADEVDAYLLTAYQQIATAQRVFWDWVYSENLPAGFSYTADWEAQDGWPAFDFGWGNWTAPAEQDLWAVAPNVFTNEQAHRAPRSTAYTCPAEATDGWLSAAGANTAIAATAEVPTSLTRIDRSVWDRRGVDQVTARDMSRTDARYELTTGEVFAILWEKDGVRTIRKVRVPAQQGDTLTVNGSWGIARTVSDLTTDGVTGSWGLPRRIKSQHPMGPDYAGLPRRFVQDGKNVRLEHFRQGRPFTSDGDVCELPVLYAGYLRDYAQGKCLERVGPGQDLKLSAHYFSRWERDLARIARRAQTIAVRRVGVLGEQADRLIERVARPKLPWPYGAVVR